MSLRRLTNALTCLLCLIAFAAVSPADSANTIAWGSEDLGLQCGLSMNTPIAAPEWQRAVLTIRNLRSLPVSFYDSDFIAISSGFSVETLSGTSVAISSSEVPGSGLYEIGGPSPQTTIQPGQSDETDYEIRFPHSPEPKGSYLLAFQADLKPVGAQEPIRLQCGPIKLSV